MSELRSTCNISVRDQIRQWYKNIPNLFHGSFKKRWLIALQRKSMKAAIHAKCLDCCCWQNTEVRECTIVTCPLYLYRPLAKRDGRCEKEVSAAASEIMKNQEDYCV